MRQINALRYLDDPENNSGNWRLKGDTVVRWSVAQGGTYAELKREWAPFDRIQSPDIVTREAVAGLMQRAHASGVRGFTVANNKAEGCAPLTMRAVAESICAMEKRRGTQRLKPHPCAVSQDKAPKLRSRRSPHRKGSFSGFRVLGFGFRGGCAADHPGNEFFAGLAAEKGLHAVVSENRTRKHDAAETERT